MNNLANKEIQLLLKTDLSRRSDSWKFDDCDSEANKKLIGLSFVPFKRRSKLPVKYIKKFV